MEEGLFTWLLDQAPVVVVMGIGIYLMYRGIEKKNKEIKELNAKILELTRETVEANQNLANTIDYILDKIQDERRK